MPVSVRSFDDQIETNTNFAFNNSRGKSSDGTYGDKIKFIIDEDDQAKPYSARTRASGLIDLTKSTSWSTNPVSAKEDLVSYTLKLYQPKYSSVLTNLFTNVSQGLQLADQSLGEGLSFDRVRSLQISNPYANMVIANDLKWTIKLPLLSLLPQTYVTQFGDGENEGGNLFSDVTNNITRFFTDNASSVSNKSKLFGPINKIVAGSLAGNLGGLTNSVARTLYPSVSATNSADRFYRGSNPIGYDLSFDLINTLDEDTTKKNIEFVRFMSYMVSARSRNRYIEDSPVIAEAEIGALRFAPLVKLDFEYQGQGNFKYVDGEPIPEAYTCKLTVQEMLPHYRNLQHEYIHRGRKLRAINTDPKVLCNTINQGISVGRNLFDRLF